MDSKAQKAALDLKEFKPRFVFRLDITPDEETLMKNMHQKTRYNLRLAGRKGVTIDTNPDRSKLAEFYDLMKVTAERDKVFDPPLFLF